MSCLGRARLLELRIQLPLTLPQPLCAHSHSPACRIRSRDRANGNMLGSAFGGMFLRAAAARRGGERRTRKAVLLPEGILARAATAVPLQQRHARASHKALGVRAVHPCNLLCASSNGSWCVADCEHLQDDCQQPQHAPCKSRTVALGLCTTTRSVPSEVWTSIRHGKVFPTVAGLAEAIKLTPPPRPS